MKQYGLIGYPLSHSFSGTYFAAKFEKEQISGCRYDLYPLKQIDELPILLESVSELCGLNVTIPYKEEVLPYLDILSPAVEEIGACNCICIRHGKLKGYNTDVVGFESILLPHLLPHHRSALILGTGGAAKAVAWVLKKLGIQYSYVSRRSAALSFSYEELTEDILKERTLIINTTPLGMYPNTDEAPALPYEHIGREHLCVDLIYNPSRTRFLHLAEERGAVVENGQRMLEIQAEESWKIWTDPIF